jgi:hypothetical protein
MGIYQINAARYLFRDEPIEAIGAGANNGDPRFTIINDDGLSPSFRASVAATLSSSAS